MAGVNNIQVGPRALAGHLEAHLLHALPFPLGAAPVVMWAHPTSRSRGFTPTPRYRAENLVTPPATPRGGQAANPKQLDPFPSPSTQLYRGCPGLGTGCQSTLARAIPSPPDCTPDPPVLCAPLALPVPQRGCKGILGYVHVCVCTGLCGHLCANTCVCSFRSVTQSIGGGGWEDPKPWQLPDSLGCSLLRSSSKRRRWHRPGSSWGSGLGCGEEVQGVRRLRQGWQAEPLRGV